MKFDFTWIYVKKFLLLTVIPTIPAEGVSTWTVRTVCFPETEIVFWRPACIKSKWILGDSNSLLKQNKLNYFFYSLPLLVRVTYIHLVSLVSCRCHSLPYLHFLQFKRSFGALRRAISTCMLHVLTLRRALKEFCRTHSVTGHCVTLPPTSRTVHIYEVHLLYLLHL